MALPGCDVSTPADSVNVPASATTVTAPVPAPPVVATLPVNVTLFVAVTSTDWALIPNDAKKLLELETVKFPNDCPAPAAPDNVMFPAAAESARSLGPAAALSTAPVNVMFPPVESTVVRGPFRITGECNVIFPLAELIVDDD